MTPPSTPRADLIAALDKAAEAEAMTWAVHLRPQIYAAIIRASRAALASEGETAGWVPIETAPKDRLVWVYAPGVQELEPITCLCEWHEDAGFCVDEVRSPTLWHPTVAPASPRAEEVKP